MKYDYLIVGSGLFGATYAYRAKKAGKKCLVIDKRPHLGGNVYCKPIDGVTGEPLDTLKPSETSVTMHPVIQVHQYGAHIFHTSNKEVWDFVNSIVEFNRYTNCPVANYKGELYNLPFNMNTFNKMWPEVTTPAEAQAKIDEQRREALEQLRTESGELREPANLEEQALCLVGKDIFYKLIKEYTEKQWGRDCKELPAFIIKRLPVRMIFDNNYFNDKYQGIPIGGYNVLIDKLLDGVECLTETDFFTATIEDIINKNHKNPSTEDEPNGLCANVCKSEFSSELGTSDSQPSSPVCDANSSSTEAKNQRFAKKLSLREGWKEIAEKLIYTGPLDQYFDYKLGKLDWRTVTFKTRIEDTPNYQGNAVVNYTSHDVPYTRVIEHKHFEMFGQEVYDCPKTVVSEEYSTEYKDGSTGSPTEPYYPVNNDRNNALAEEYRKLAEKENNVIFGGRLAQYKYYDMAPVIEQVLNMNIE